MLSDADVVAIIERMIKQRRESVAQFEAGKRPDLVAHERAEIDILQSYMPQALSDAEVDALIAAAVAQVRRRHGGDGQGHGGAEAAARRPRRHGRGLGQGQGQAFAPDRIAPTSMPRAAEIVAYNGLMGPVPSLRRSMARRG